MVKFNNRFYFEPKKKGGLSLAYIDQTQVQNMGCPHSQRHAPLHHEYNELRRCLYRIHAQTGVDVIFPDVI